ncbi:MAG: 30S ribosomal protein S13 [Candidatus Pacearchaeota archaeon]
MDKIIKQNKEEKEENLIRILSVDIPSNMRVYPALTKIKGVSWSFSNAVCNILDIDKNKRISELTKEEIDKISNFIQNPDLPSHLFNRRNERESKEDIHLIGSDLDLRKEFDIKRLKKIRSYRGLRHATGQPVRGQRTKSHFRKNKVVGVQRKKQQPTKSKK